MSKYDVYGLGNALVDMEFEVEDGFLNLMEVDKGVMTLVDEDEQHRLMTHLDAFEGNKASCGSAANTLIAVSAMLLSSLSVIGNTLLLLRRQQVNEGNKSQEIGSALTV